MSTSSIEHATPWSFSSLRKPTRSLPADAAHAARFAAERARARAGGARGEAGHAAAVGRTDVWLVLARDEAGHVAHVLLAFMVHHLVELGLQVLYV